MKLTRDQIIRALECCLTCDCKRKESKGICEMNRDKQIEEMAEAIFQNCNCGLFFSETEKISNFIINKQGYRKASEVAREMFAEFRTEMRSLIETSNELYIKSGDDDYYLGKKDAFFTAILHLEELIKKKYTEDTE